MSKNSNALIYICLLCLLCLIAEQADKIKKLESRRPEIIYKVDNAGSGLAGIVIGKEFDGNRYSITVSGYGKFLVNKEQYDRAIIGKGWKHE